MIGRMTPPGPRSPFPRAARPQRPPPGARGIAGSGAVRQARVTAPRPQATPPVQERQQDQGKSLAPATGSAPPRGSLLDLSV